MLFRHAIHCSNGQLRLPPSEMFISSRFRSFQVVSGRLQVVSARFRSFQLVSGRFNFYQLRFNGTPSTLSSIFLSIILERVKRFVFVRS